MESQNIEYTTLGTSGLKVSAIALGTWAIGGWMWGGTDEQESLHTIRAALDRGIDLIDTAPVYGFGRSEEIVGKAVKASGARERIKIATKVGLDWNDQGKVVRNATRQRILDEIDDSLKRLQTEYVDLYQIHWPDPLTPVEESAEVMRELLESGKIRAIGVSNFSPEQMETFRGIAPLHSVQPPYNLFERQVENDILPFARDNDLAVLAYGAICRGLLSGRMTPDTAFQGDDLRQHDPKFRKPRFSQYLEAVKGLEAFAAERYGRSVLELALRWVLDQGAIALWGVRRPEQLEPLDRIFGWRLSDRDLQEIDTLISAAVSDPVGPEFMAPPARKSG